MLGPVEVCLIVMTVLPACLLTENNGKILILRSAPPDTAFRSVAAAI